MATQNLDHTVYKITVDGEKIVFVPTYSAIVVKSLDNVNIKESEVSVNFTLVLRFLLSGLDKSIQDGLKTSISFRLNEKPIILKRGEENVLIKEEYMPGGEFVLIYTYRTIERVSFRSKLKYTPFDLLKIRLKIEMMSKDTEDDKTRYRFNFHVHDVSTVNIYMRPKDPEDRYEFNTAYDEIHYSIEKEGKSRKKNHLKLDSERSPRSAIPVKKWYSCLKKQPPVQIIRSPTKEFKEDSENYIYTYYPVVKFDFGMYRKPAPMLLTSVIPVFTCGLISLAINAQDKENFTSRIQNISTMVLTLFAFLPSLRADIPTAPYITLTDYFVYLFYLQNLVVLIDTVVLKYTSDQTTSTYVLSALSIFFLCMMGILLVVFSIRYQIKKKTWDLAPPEQKKQSGKMSFKNWKNGNIVASEDSHPEILYTAASVLNQEAPNGEKLNTDLDS